MWKHQESFLVYYDSNSSWALNVKDNLDPQATGKRQGNEFKNWHSSDYNIWKTEEYPFKSKFGNELLQKSSSRKMNQSVFKKTEISKHNSVISYKQKEKHFFIKNRLHMSRSLGGPLT